MLVKIIRGTYGHRPNPEESRVLRKDSKSPAFELNDAEAERLIALEVAVACKTEEIAETKAVKISSMTEAEIMSLDFNDMRKLAKEHGLDTKGTKEELAFRLKEAFLKKDSFEENEEGDEDIFVDDEEIPPELEAQEPV